MLTTILNIFFSLLAALPPLDKRQLNYGDKGSGYRPAAEDQACVDYLFKQGGEYCSIPNENTIFCLSGDTVVTGRNIYTKNGDVSSLWYVSY